MKSLSTSGVRFALRPTREQAQALAQWAGCQRFVYNAKVGEDEYFWGLKRKALDFTGIQTPIDAMYSQFKDKELTPWLFDVPSQVLRNGASRWHETKWKAVRGECGQPAKKRRGVRQSVLLTPELFELVPLGEHESAPRGTHNKHRLRIGTKTRDLGFVEFIAHRDYRLPKQITVSRDADSWWVSFNFGSLAEDWGAPADERPWWAQGVDPQFLRSPQELMYEFANLGEEALAAATLGVDRGVANPMADSRGVFHAPDKICQERIKRKEVGTKRHQRQLAKQVQGSANSRKTKRKIAKKQAYGRRVRKDWVEKATTAIACDDSILVVAIEDLNTKGMTKAPAAKPGEKPGEFLPNGAAAKAGLNKGILGACWGQIEVRLGQKLAARNKVLVKVRAQYSSQECSECGHAHALNRPSQAVFKCQGCAHAEHADTNAPKVLGGRAVSDILSGKARRDALDKAKAAKPTKAERIEAKRVKLENEQKALEEAGNAGRGPSGVSVEPLGGRALESDGQDRGVEAEKEGGGSAPVGSSVL